MTNARSPQRTARQPGCTTWGSNQIQRQDNTRHVFQGVMSYVTGSHSFKFGYNHEIGPDGRMGNTHNGDLYQNYTAGAAELGRRVEHAARGARASSTTTRRSSCRTRGRSSG